METKARLRYARIAPRKVRLVADVVKGKQVELALTVLRAVPRVASKVLEKMVRSAVASAFQNFHSDQANLYIKKIVVDEGPKLKRYRPRARGRAYEIQKKTSHITLVLDEIVPMARPEVRPVGKRSKRRESTPKGGAFLRSKFRPLSEVIRPKKEIGTQRFFRRKAV